MPEIRKRMIKYDDINDEIVTLPLGIHSTIRPKHPELKLGRIRAKVLKV